MAWDELAAHDAQASRQPARLKQASHTASAINVAAAPAIPSTQRYEKITEIAHSVKEQTLIHIALDNGQHITATAGHPFKTSEGWRDAVLLKKGGKLLLKDSESDAQAAPRYASITAVSTETKTTPVYNLEVANLHTFFVGEAGVGVHNGIYDRPSGFRAGVRDSVWNGAIEMATGRVRDPQTGRFMSKCKPWDMGHKPGHEWRRHKKDLERRGADRETILGEHNDPHRYRPELPSSNRNHRSEDNSPF